MNAELLAFANDLAEQLDGRAEELRRQAADPANVGLAAGLCYHRAEDFALIANSVRRAASAH